MAQSYKAQFLDAKSISMLMMSLGIHGEKAVAKTSSEELQAGNKSKNFSQKGIDGKESRELAIKFPQFDPDEMYVTYQNFLLGLFSLYETIDMGLEEKLDNPYLVQIEEYLDEHYDTEGV